MPSRSWMMLSNIRFRTDVLGVKSKARSQSGRLRRMSVEVLESRTLLTAFSAQQLISSATDNVFDVHAADLDGDGDQDVLSASRDDDTIAWYENQGGGVFGTQQQLSTTSDFATCVYTADLDGDGDLDVLAASADDDTVAWFENLGGGSFGTRSVITTAADRVYCAYAADLDGDGDQDVLSASFGDNKVAWYENDGNGVFGAQQVITTATTGALTVHASDLDGDGDPDVLASSMLADTVVWCENQGSGVFGAPQVITDLGSWVCCAYAADLDGDGDQDVLSTSYLDDTIAWYENQGGGVFGAQQVLSATADGVNSVHTEDLDGDGDQDVVSTFHLANTVAWFENLGGGNFGSAQVVSNTASGAEDVATSDLDGDGDPDLLVAAGVGDTVAWYEQNSTPTLNVIADVTLNENAAVQAIDLQGITNGSGETGPLRVTAVSDDPSKVQVTSVDYTSPTNTATLQVTPGLDALGTAEITVTVEDAGFDGDIETSGDNQTFSRSFDVQLVIPAPVWDAPVGIVSDQTPALSWSNVDVLASGDGANHYEVWVNNLSTGQEKVIHQTQVGQNWLSSTLLGAGQSLTTTAAGATAIHQVDLDGDNDLDLLLAANVDDEVTWYENQGGGTFAAGQTIASGADGALSVYSADLDGDSDPDVLVASIMDNTVAWYENQGSGVFGSQQVITTEPSWLASVHADDLDGDGDPDVLSASYLDDTIAWYENQGGGVFGARQIIDTASDGAWCVYTADVDGDGDPDVLTASREDDSIAWHENQGSGVFGARQVISSAADNVWCVYADDLDGDGDLDVLSASADDDKVAWYENQGGGTFGAQQVITSETDQPLTLTTADMDGDGDPDVLSASYSDNVLAWYENLGGGVFGAQHKISTTYNGMDCVAAGDLDGDGDPDVISASRDDGTLAWYTNQNADLGIGRFSAWVRAFDSQGRSGPWSSTGRFRIATASQVLTPAADTTDLTPTVSWDAIPGASRYELWVDDVDRGQQRVMHQTNLTTTSYTPTDSVPAGRYRIWVRAFDVEENATLWSSPHTFQVRVIPQFAGDINSTGNPRPELSWNAVDDADHYELWVRGLGQGQDPYIHETQLSGTQFTPTADMPIGAYYGWIRGVYADDSTTDWSAVERFRIVTSTEITGPVGRDSDRTPTIQWNSVLGADCYELWVSNKSTGQSQVIHKTDITSTEFTPPSDIPVGVYQSWLRAVDSQGILAQWSACHEFTVTLPPPTIVTPQGTVSGSAVQFEWTSVTDAQQYELWVRNLTTGQDKVVHNANVTNTQYTHNDQLSAGDYRMWVRAFDANGVVGDWIAGDFQVAGRLLPDASTADQNSTVPDLLLPLTEWTAFGAGARVASTDMLPWRSQAELRSEFAERTLAVQMRRSANAGTQKAARQPEEPGEQPRASQLSETEPALIDQALQEWLELGFDSLSGGRVASGPASS